MNDVERISSLTNFSPNKRLPANFSILHHPLTAHNLRGEDCLQLLLGLKGLILVNKRKQHSCLDFMQLFDDVVKCGVRLVNVEQGFFFNLEQEEFGVSCYSVFSEVPVVDDSSGNHMFIIHVTLVAIVTRIVDAHFGFSIDHAYQQ